MILSNLGSRLPFLKKYRKFEKNNYGKISITGPDLDPEKIEKFEDRFGRQILHLKKKALKSLFLNLFSIFKNPVCSIFHYTQ